MKYYNYGYDFNAWHSMSGEEKDSHPHTFHVAVSIVDEEHEKDQFFYELDQEIRLFFEQFRGKYLNTLEEFQFGIPTIEYMGDVFFEQLYYTLKFKNISLLQLEISENPLCVYMVSDRLLLPTLSMKESHKNYKDMLAVMQKINLV